jgi:hypothetical protein
MKLLFRYAILTVFAMFGITEVQSATRNTFTLGGSANAVDADMTYINSQATTSNYGNGITGWVGDSTQLRTAILIRWPAIVDSLAHEGSTFYVEKAWLYFKTTSSGPNINTKGYLKVAALRRSWVELQATYAVYATGLPWGTAGAVNTTSDIDTTVTVSVALSNHWQGVAGDIWDSIDVTSIAQTMDKGDTAKWRYGFALYGPWSYSGITGWDGGQINYHSDSATTTANRPRIKIIYTSIEPPSATQCRFYGYFKKQDGSVAYPGVFIEVNRSAPVNSVDTGSNYSGVISQVLRGKTDTLGYWNEKVLATSQFDDTANGYWDIRAIWRGTEIMRLNHVYAPAGQSVNIFDTLANR